MNIGINISPLKTGQNLTGIGNYLYQTVTRIINADSVNEYYLFINGSLMDGIDLPVRRNVHVVTIKCKSSLIMNRYLMTLQIRKYSIDLFWSPIHNLPCIQSKKTKYCMTVYDLANYKFTNMAAYGGAKRRLFYHIVRNSCRAADRIIAISEATKRDVMEMFGVSGDKISVVYLGGPGCEMPKTDPNTHQRYGITKPYFLYVGTLQTRKNISTIVKAFIKLKRNAINTQLVLAGGMGWGMEETKSIIEGSDCKEDIILTGFISETEKWELYKNANCFVFPSLYEGFGIPILEAFTFGIPVITARNSSLPEVGGSAAIYIEDTVSEKELTDKMREVLQMTDDERASIAEKEAAQLARFNWDKCALETGKILRIC